MTAPTSRQSESIGRFFERRAAGRPDAAAVVWGETTIALVALLEESRRVAQGLSELGVRQGDRVALWLPNTPAWLALYLACARLGAIAVAVNTRFRAAEIADIVGRSGAQVLALWPDFRGVDFLGILAEVDRAALDRLEAIIAVEGDAGPSDRLHGKRLVGYDALHRRPPFERDHGDGPAGSIIFTTSGTTSAPKFVLHDHFSVTRHAAAVARRFAYDAPGTILLQALPLGGVFGFSQMMAALAGGARSVMPATFEPEESAWLIERHQVTSFNGSDEMVDRLLAGRPGERPFPSLGACYYASFNPSLDAIAAEAEARGVSLSGLYGMSEVQALFARQRPEAPVAERGRPGGFPVGEGYGARVRDPESGRLLPPGESGELELSGPSLMAGYYGDAEATARAMTEDGWVRTGDLARLVGDGSFVFETRLGDVLRLGGYLVAPAEIEAHIQRFPPVDACQVVGVQSPLGPAAVAFVTLRDGITFEESAARRFCLHGLARYKVPMRFIVLSEFPTTTSANGTKVQRGRLREMAQRLIGG
ncbi:MAG TPA: AMP-binding protein [Alphaproteobacteria bacterium]|nr:AMP-binding protein [Alphaproteobacteria bacterium]